MSLWTFNPKVPKGWRLLKRNEVIKQGDMFWGVGMNRWMYSERRGWASGKSFDLDGKPYRYIRRKKTS